MAEYQIAVAKGEMALTTMIVNVTALRPAAKIMFAISRQPCGRRRVILRDPVGNIS